MEFKIYSPAEDGFLQSIDWNFGELKQEIVKKADDYMNLVYSGDQIKEAKKDRANLRKFISALEDKRKEIKKQVMLPYTDFEAKEKELVGIVEQAVKNIDIQVKAYEDDQREKKLEKVKEIYEEAIGDLDRTVPFDKIYKETWLNASVTLKSIKEEIEGIHDKVDADLKVINMESSAYAYEMKEEYLKSFDLSAAMAKKQELEETARKKAVFEARKKKEAEEREARLKAEAARVESAGKASEPPVDNAAQETVQQKERTLAITFKVTAKEGRFQEVNALIAQLKETSEAFEILGQEEL